MKSSKLGEFYKFMNEFILPLCRGFEEYASAETDIYSEYMITAPFKCWRYIQERTPAQWEEIFGRQFYTEVMDFPEGFLEQVPNADQIAERNWMVSRWRNHHSGRVLEMLVNYECENIHKDACVVSFFLQFEQ